MTTQHIQKSLQSQANISLDEIRLPKSEKRFWEQEKENPTTEAEIITYYEDVISKYLAKKLPKTAQVEFEPYFVDKEFARSQDIDIAKAYRVIVRPDALLDPFREKDIALILYVKTVKGKFALVPFVLPHEEEMDLGEKLKKKIDKDYKKNFHPEPQKVLKPFPRPLSHTVLTELDRRKNKVLAVLALSAGTMALSLSGKQISRILESSARAISERRISAELERETIRIQKIATLDREIEDAVRELSNYSTFHPSYSLTKEHFLHLQDKILHGLKSEQYTHTKELILLLGPEFSHRTAALSKGEAQSIYRELLSQPEKLSPESFTALTRSYRAMRAVYALDRES